MGTTVENVARQWQLSREEQRTLSHSPRRTTQKKAGHFADEIIPLIVKGRNGDVTVDQDEYIRYGTQRSTR
ncbi:thiolase family protein [Bradyrhizobium sp. Arg314]